MRCGQGSCWVGPALVAAGTTLPALLPHHLLGILPQVREAIVHQDSGRLLLAAGALVVLNTVRAIPIYVGAFLTAGAIGSGASGPARRWLGWLTPLLLIPSTYGLVQAIHGVRYDFGGPAVAGVLAATLVHRMAEGSHGRFMRGTILAIFLLGLQWLDVVPALTAYGFGNGELSMDVKLAAAFLDSERLLTLWGLAGFGTFTAIALLMALFMVDQRKHVALLLARQAEELQAARAEARAREEAERNRALVEVQALVHDLKTPLSTVSGLVSLLGLSPAVAGDRRLRGHVARVEGAVATMTQMIAEILSPQAARQVSGRELVRYLMAQFSAVDTGGGGNPLHGPAPSSVVFQVSPQLPPVRVNLLRVSRALLNVLINGQRAAGLQGRVRVRVTGTARELRIRVRDWGPGMDPAAARRVFEPGFGLSGSSGMGLTFARSVVEGELGGRLTLKSVAGRGTLVVVRIPAWREGEEDAHKGRAAAPGRGGR